jgi:hypothetical protein
MSVTMTGGGHVANNRGVNISVVYYKMPRFRAGERSGRASRNLLQFRRNDSEATPNS